MDPPLLARPRVLAWAIGGAAAVGAVMLCLGGVVATAAVLAALALFAGPGFFLWRIVAPRDGGDAFERAIVGALVGIGLSATVTVVLALAIGLRPVPIAVTLVGLTALPAIAGW